MSEQSNKYHVCGSQMIEIAQYWIDNKCPDLGTVRGVTEYSGMDSGFTISLKRKLEQQTPESEETRA